MGNKHGIYLVPLPASPEQGAEDAAASQGHRPWEELKLEHSTAREEYLAGIQSLTRGLLRLENPWTGEEEGLRLSGVLYSSDQLALEAAEAIAEVCRSEHRPRTPFNFGEDGSETDTHDFTSDDDDDDDDGEEERDAGAEADAGGSVLPVTSETSHGDDFSTDRGAGETGGELVGAAEISLAGSLLSGAGRSHAAAHLTQLLSTSGSPSSSFPFSSFAASATVASITSASPPVSGNLAAAPAFSTRRLSQLDPGGEFFRAQQQEEQEVSHGEDPVFGFHGLSLAEEEEEERNHVGEDDDHDGVSRPSLPFQRPKLPSIVVEDPSEAPEFFLHRDPLLDEQNWLPPDGVLDPQTLDLLQREFRFSFLEQPPIQGINHGFFLLLTSLPVIRTVLASISQTDCPKCAVAAAREPPVSNGSAIPSCPQCRGTGVCFNHQLLERLESALSSIPAQESAPVCAIEVLAEGGAAKVSSGRLLHVSRLETALSASSSTSPSSAASPPFSSGGRTGFRFVQLNTILEEVENLERQDTLTRLDQHSIWSSGSGGGRGGMRRGGGGSGLGDLPRFSRRGSNRPLPSLLEQSGPEEQDALENPSDIAARLLRRRRSQSRGRAELEEKEEESQESSGSGSGSSSSRQQRGWEKNI